MELVQYAPLNTGWYPVLLKNQLRIINIKNIYSVIWNKTLNIVADDSETQWCQIEQKDIELYGSENINNIVDKCHALGDKFRALNYFDPDLRLTVSEDVHQSAKIFNNCISFFSGIGYRIGICYVDDVYNDVVFAINSVTSDPNIIYLFSTPQLDLLREAEKLLLELMPVSKLTDVIASGD